MNCKSVLIAAALALAVSAPAEARSHHRHKHSVAWCGYYMMKKLHVTNPNGARALWWKDYGAPANGPAIGVLVIWDHGGGHGHVGIITGRDRDGWRVESGNDGNRVRDRVRRVDNAVAFRWPT